jgi:hypothetical protein
VISLAFVQVIASRRLLRLATEPANQPRDTAIHSDTHPIPVSNARLHADMAQGGNPAGTAFCFGEFSLCEPGPLRWKTLRHWSNRIPFPACRETEKARTFSGSRKKVGEQTTMASIGRRGFVKGATLGALAVTVAGAEVFMTAGEARARGVPFRLLDAHQGETLEALGETLVPQAREAGIAHFIDQQLSVPPHEALLQARIFNFRPPFAEFYRSAIAAVDEGSRKIFGRDFAQLSATDQREFIDRLRQNKIEGWTGPPGTTIYAVLRADAVDVVYGTMEGYEALGIPYMPHIPPEKRW